MTKTEKQYDEVIASCKQIFLLKVKDYGTAWRILRTISIIDQLYIKAKRIRTIQEAKEQKIADSVPTEFKGIANYSVIGLMQLGMTNDDPKEIEYSEISEMYNNRVAMAKKLMQDKNHDYGEAWREMSQESFVDLILMKLNRIKQIISNEGKTIISENIDAGYFDILNYAVFALIMISEENTNKN